MFLLSVEVDVNSRVQDATLAPPLHLAAEVGHEVLLRSLLLAGARPNDRDAHKYANITQNSFDINIFILTGIVPSESFGFIPLHTFFQQQQHHLTKDGLCMRLPLDPFLQTALTYRETAGALFFDMVKTFVKVRHNSLIQTQACQTVLTFGWDSALSNSLTLRFRG